MRFSPTTALLAASSLATVLARPSPPVLHLAKPTIYAGENDISTFYDRITVTRDISPSKTLPDPPFVTHVVIDGEDIEIHARNKDLAIQIIPLLKDYICHSDDAVLFPKLCQDGIPHDIPGDVDPTEQKHHATYAPDNNTTTTGGLHHNDVPLLSPTVPVMDASTATQAPRVAGVDARKSLPSASNPHEPGDGDRENATRMTSRGSLSGPSSTPTSEDCPNKVTVTTTIHPVHTPSSKGRNATMDQSGSHNSGRVVANHGYNAYSNSPSGSLDLPSTFSTRTVIIWPNSSASAASDKQSTIEAYKPDNRRLEVLNNDTDTSGEHSAVDDRQEIINGWEQLKKATWRQFQNYEDFTLIKLKSSKSMVIDAVKEIDNVIATFNTLMSRDGDRETRSS